MHYLLIFITSLFTSFGKSETIPPDYEAMWAKVEAFENERLPQSALEIVDQIYKEAKQEGNDGQLVKAIIYKVKLRTSFEDKDPGNNIVNLENELQNLDSDEAKSLNYSLLGELYHDYGIRNMYRYQNRSNGANNVEELPFKSLEDIQEKAFDYYFKSIQNNHQDALSDWDVLIKKLDDNTFKIKASTLQEFLEFRAAKHFTNSQSLLTIPLGDFKMDKEEYFADDVVFGQLDFIGPEDNFHLNALKLFQKFANDITLTEDKKLQLRLMRLDFLKNNSRLPKKNECYFDALVEMTESERTSPSLILVYVKIVEHFISKGQQNSQAKSSDKTNNYLEAYRWIQKGKNRKIDSEYNKILDQQKAKVNGVYMRMDLENVVLPNNNFIGYLSYRNVSKVYFRIYKMTEKKILKFNELRNQGEKFNFVKEQDMVRSWNLDLPSSEDYNFHSFEFFVEKLPLGQFVIVASNNSDFGFNSQDVSNFNFVNVSNLTYIFHQEEGRMEGKVLNRTNGEPIADADVDVYHLEYNRSKRNQEWVLVDKLKSNSKGGFSYSAPQRNYTLRVKKGTDLLDLKTSHYNYNQDYTSEYLSASIFTDRSIYRPGQIVYYKGLVYKSNTKDRLPHIEKNKEVKILLRDVNYQIVEERTLSTNEYGTLNGSFILPSGGLTGLYSLSFEMKGGNAQKSIQVEEYKRPKFVVSVDSLDKSYVLGDSVALTVNLNAFSSAALANVTMSYQITKKKNSWFYRYGFEGRGPVGGQEVVALGKVVTDQNGKAQIVFETEKASGNESFIYNVEIVATDITGLTATGTKAMVLTNQPFTFTNTLPRNVFTSQIPSFKLEVKNTEGVTVPSVVDLEVLKLNHPEEALKNKYWNVAEFSQLDSAEYAKKLPLESFGASNSSEKWSEIKSVFTKSFKGESMLYNDLKDLQSGAYKLKFKVQTDSGHSEEYVQYLNVTAENKCAIPTEFIWSKSVQSEYQPGDKLEIGVNTPYKKFIVYYILSKGKAVLKKGQITNRKKSVDYVISNNDRGNLNLQYVLVKDNRLHVKNEKINIPWKNKDLHLKLTKFRNRVSPGSTEDVTLVVKSQKGNAKDVELTAALYDKSLDELKGHSWKKSFYPFYSLQAPVQGVGFNLSRPYTLQEYHRFRYQTSFTGFEPQFNWFGFNSMSRNFGNVAYNDQPVMKRAGAPMAAMEADSGSAVELEAIQVESENNETIEDQLGTNDDNNKTNQSNLVRENLNETVFFYPDLKSDENGEVHFKYTMNDALTKWKLLLFGISEDFEYTFDEYEIETFKDVLVEPNLPRFLRQGDDIYFNAKVSNLSDMAVELNCQIELTDAFSDAMLNNSFQLENINQKITLESGESKEVIWRAKVPIDFTSLVDIKMIADNDQVSDGEKNRLPVLSNRVLVTESLPIHIPGQENTSVQFRALDKLSASESLTPHSFMLEFYSNPTWIILRALPSMMDEDPKVTSDVMDALYSVELGSHLIETNSSVSKVLEKWIGSAPNSTLNTNANFKISDIRETPWLRDAMAEEINIERLSLFLNKNNTNQRLKSLSRKLKSRQLSNGGFTWMPEGRDNWYTTQYILQALVKLSKLGIVNASEIIDLPSAITYLDKSIIDYHERHIDNSKNLSPLVIQYLYIRTHFNDYDFHKGADRVFKHYADLGKDKWQSESTFMQAHLAYVYLNDSKTTADAILKSLKERVVKDDVLGYYWNDQAGYYWYDNNVEKQAFMIDLFKEAKQDEEWVDGMKIWLLKNKQVNSWKTNKQTASAVYAFMSDSDKWLVSDQLLKIFNANNEVLSFKTEDSPEGYLKKEIKPSNITSELKSLRVENPNSNIAWGSAHWQYFEDIDKVKSYTDTPLKIDKAIYKKRETEKGSELKVINDGDVLNPGDKMTVRIELTVDRPMEFMQMKDLRASNVDPINVLSQRKWQDGLSYYESTKDVASYFYFDYLPKGNFVFEYDVFVNQKGTFSNGMTIIQSMYAPEFNSHSGGGRITVQ